MHPLGIRLGEKGYPASNQEYPTLVTFSAVSHSVDSIAWRLGSHPTLKVLNLWRIRLIP